MTTYQLPDETRANLRTLWEAYQHDLSLVCNMLGIPAGAEYTINLETGEVVVQDAPSLVEASN